MFDTIAAISTPLAPGGIGIVRISGDMSREIASKIFFPRSKDKSIMSMKGYTACYGKVKDAGKEIDEAIALVFRSPLSYTGEDVVELSCHGGIYALQRTLRAALSAGARAASPGEFTKRAYLNGKLSLDEAESVMSIINAQSESALSAALSLKEGALFKQIQQVKGTLVSAAAHMSVWADYPEEDIEALELDKLKSDFLRAEKVLSRLLDQYDAGQAILEGVNAAIVGKPNVGKSTLMNLLSGRERSIVSDIPGTTRDIVENVIRIGDVTLNISDTAGIREARDEVEKIGVELAKAKISGSDLILAVFDSSEPLGKEDFELIEFLKGKTCIAIINKSDLPLALDSEYISKSFDRTAFISAGSGEGYEELKAAVSDALRLSELDPSQGILATERQRRSCEKAKASLQEALDSIEIGITLDAINICVDDAIGALAELTGESVAQAVADEVFTRFCVGK